LIAAVAAVIVGARGYRLFGGRTPRRSSGGTGDNAFDPFTFGEAADT
jgi:hypothetical protein